MMIEDITACGKKLDIVLVSSEVIITTLRLLKKKPVIPPIFLTRSNRL
jgi:hypothetical protein